MNVGDKKVMRYTFIHEKNGYKYETDNTIDYYRFLMEHNCTNANVMRVIMSKEYIITTYKSNYTLFIKREI